MFSLPIALWPTYRPIVTLFKMFEPPSDVRIFDFSEVVAEVSHFSVGGVFGGLSLGAWLGIN